MDYVVGSVAALISGNVTPNRPRLVRRALTPTKHQPSPNVTPKSEFVDDRSAFLSPTMQKKKAIVKKSPKRIFQNPDLDATNDDEGNTSVNSLKADKVKKHLKEDLESSDTAIKATTSPKSPKKKLKKSSDDINQDIKSNMDGLLEKMQQSNENTPKKKKKKNNPNVDINEKVELNVDTKENTPHGGKNPKNKKNKNNKSNANKHCIIKMDIDSDGKELEKSPEKEQNKNDQIKPDEIEKPQEDKSGLELNKPNKKKNNKRRNKNKNNKATEEKPIKEAHVTNDDKKKSKKLAKKNVTDAQDESPKTSFVNPNAITTEDTDSEHGSDDEIESENENINKDVLDTPAVEESSDEEEPVPSKPKEKKETVVETEEELKRTLFVGNVPFSNKCKKEIKKIFSKHGQIETIRIRTVPVKDARVTPKLAVIREELHPERSTVNVYIKYNDADSVENALVENNTVLNEHHLRVSRSDSTGSEHDPNCSVFVGNLPFALEDETFRATFEKCGEIESVRIIRDKKTNAGKGFGYVNFVSKDGVELALELTEEDLTIKNRILRVKRCTLAQKQGNQQNQRGISRNRGFGNRGQFNGPRGGSKQRGGFASDRGGFVQRGGNSQRGGFGSQRGGFGHRGGNSQRGFGSQRGGFAQRGGNSQRGGFGSQRGGFGQRGGFASQRGGFNRGGMNNFGRNAGDQNENDGAFRRIMNKRPNPDGSDGPPNKKQNLNQPGKEKKARKEFVGMTGEKKKKHKFDKGQKKKKLLSEILTK